MKKVILYIGGFELPDKNAAAQRCVSNAKIFRDLGYEIVMLGVNKTSHQPTQELNHFGFTCWSTPYPNSTKSWLSYITSLNQVEHLLEEKYRNQVFAVICYNYPAIAQYRIKNLAKKHGALALADVTEWYSASGDASLRKGIKWLDITLRMRCVNFLMDGLITTSKHLTTFYQKKTLVELPTLFDKSEQVFHKAEISNGEGYTLMYAGSPFDVAQAAKDKSCVKERLDLVIESLYKLKLDGVNFRLNIFGVGEDDYLKVYPEDSKKLEGLCGVVVFKGRQPHRIILENIISSDFTIFLRDVNRVTLAGFPSKFSESISYGTPVITNLISNIEPYVVEDKNCFLVDIDDKDKRYEALKLILTMPREGVKVSKDFCLNTVAFDCFSFTERVGVFIKKLKKNNEH